MAFFRFFKYSVLCFSLLTFSHIQAYDPTGPCLIVQNPHNSGFFAVFTSVLGALDMYEKDGYSGLKVELDGWYLDPSLGPNWWEYYFEPIHLESREPVTSSHLIDFHEMGMVIGRGFMLGRQRANELIQRYIHIKPEIQTEVEAFTTKNFRGRFIIGVHYRGTDKGSECPLVPYETTSKRISQIIKDSHFSKKDIKIYVATDQADFLAFMLKRFPKNVIYNNFVRSPNADPLHISSHLYTSNYQKGKEALLDCLILSRCNVLVRSPNSSLSVTSGRFNLKQVQAIVRAPNTLIEDLY